MAAPSHDNKSSESIHSGILSPPSSSTVPFGDNTTCLLHPFNMDGKTIPESDLALKKLFFFRGDRVGTCRRAWAPLTGDTTLLIIHNGDDLSTVKYVRILNILAAL